MPVRRFVSSPTVMDRILGWSFLILHIAMAIFIVYTSFEQNRAEKARQDTLVARERAETDRAQLNTRVAEQNRLLLCFATDTQSFNLAIADALLSGPATPEQADEVKRLETIRDRLAASERFAQANPPACEY
jgi:hypothetical protein